MGGKPPPRDEGKGFRPVLYAKPPQPGGLVGLMARAKLNQCKFMSTQTKLRNVMRFALAGTPSVVDPTCPVGPSESL